jgi:BioD-like phosphotransacetylase family protein
VLAALPEDRILAAPSVGDIASAIQARWLAGERDGQSVESVMIGTVASDAAEPYFANRGNTCVVTRFDKTDIQLAALQTDVRCLVLTSGGTPSPYLIDRVQSSRGDVAVFAASGSTADTVRAIEPLFGVSRFAGDAKLARAVSLLDDAGFSLDV